MVTADTTPEHANQTIAVNEQRDLTPAHTASAAIRFRISGDTINKATETLPDEQREAMRWFAGYCRRKNLGREEVATLLRKPDGRGYYSWDSIYQALTGRRTEAGASLDQLIGAIAAFRRIAEERDEQIDSGFIQTRLYDLIESRCLRALHRKKIGFLFGDGQIGKSRCLQEVQRRHNHGQTIYVEMPTQGSLTALLAELAAQLNISKLNSTLTARRVIESFDDRMLLIVDEFHRSCSQHVGSRGLQVASFIRELWNKRQCGVMLSMTNEGRDALRGGPHRKTLEQLWRRRIQPLQLPSAPFDDDLDRFAISYGLDPAPDEAIEINTTALDDTGREVRTKFTDNPRRLQAAVSAAEGLGVWLTILQDASDMARAQKRSITWGAVLKAYTLSQAEAEEVR